MSTCSSLGAASSSNNLAHGSNSRGTKNSSYAFGTDGVGELKFRCIPHKYDRPGSPALFALSYSTRASAATRLATVLIGLLRLSAEDHCVSGLSSHDIEDAVGWTAQELPFATCCNWPGSCRSARPAITVTAK